MKAKAIKLRDRINALRTRHSELNRRIRDEMSRPVPDGLRVQTLKRMRLKAKDQITMVMRQVRHMGATQAPGAA